MGGARELQRSQETGRRTNVVALVFPVERQSLCGKKNTYIFIYIQIDYYYIPIFSRVFSVEFIAIIANRLPSVKSGLLLFLFFPTRYLDMAVAVNIVLVILGK